MGSLNRSVNSRDAAIDVDAEQAFERSGQRLFGGVGSAVNVEEDGGHEEVVVVSDSEVGANDIAALLDATSETGGVPVIPASAVIDETFAEEAETVVGETDMRSQAMDSGMGDEANQQRSEEEDYEYMSLGCDAATFLNLPKGDQLELMRCCIEMKYEMPFERRKVGAEEEAVTVEKVMNEFIGGDLGNLTGIALNFGNREASTYQQIVNKFIKHTTQ